MLPGQFTVAGSQVTEDLMLDLQIGPNGSEHKIGFSFYNWARSGQMGDRTGQFIPHHIPKGTRISLRGRSIGGAHTTGNMYAQLFGVTRGWHGHKGYQRYLELGQDFTYNDAGQSSHQPNLPSHVMGGLVNAPQRSSISNEAFGNSTWQELSAFCPMDVYYVIPRFWPSTSGNTHETNASFANTGRYYAFQLGIGDVGEEQIIGNTFFMIWTVASTWTQQAPLTLPGFDCYIPKGSRVVVRPVTSQSDASDHWQSVLLNCWG
jgi:hypothetical protein